MIEFAVALDDVVAGVGAVGAGAAGFAHAGGEVGIGEKADQGGGDQSGVADGGDQAGGAAGGRFARAAFDQFAAGADIGTDAGNTGREGFQNNKGQTFAETGEEHEVDGGKQVLALLRAEELHMVLQAELAAEILAGGGVVRFLVERAGDEEAGGGELIDGEAGGAEQGFDVLNGDDTAKETDGPPVTRPTRRGFGSTVIGGMINMGLDCVAEIDYAPTGLRWRIACPANSIVEGAKVAKAPPAPRSIKAAATDLKRVLVVEDEALIAMEIAAILSDAGFTVIGPVGSVAQALALIERLGCEAAVLDINLGKETAEPIARVLSARATPFVTISGYSREQQPAAFRNAPLVSKPVRPELLVAEIRKCLSNAY